MKYVYKLVIYYKNGFKFSFIPIESLKFSKLKIKEVISLKAI